MQTATPTQIFVVNVISNNVQNPNVAFNEQAQVLDFSDQMLWSLLTIKALEQNANYRPLAQKLLVEGFVQVTELMVKAAALNFIQVMQAHKVMTDTSDKINDIMKDFHFNEKVIISNKIVDEMLNYARTIFNCATEHQIIELRDYLEQQNLTQFCSLIPEVEQLSMPM